MKKKNIVTIAELRRLSVISDRYPTARLIDGKIVEVHFDGLYEEQVNGIIDGKIRGVQFYTPLVKSINQILTIKLDSKLVAKRIDGKLVKL